MACSPPVSAAATPAGTVEGLPVGMQVLAPHHRDAELFDLAHSPDLQSIVEIGSYVGASAAAMGAGLMRMAVNQGRLPGIAQ